MGAAYSELGPLGRAGIGRVHPHQFRHTYATTF
ncbi:hypothetical protein BH23ACT10_BH23ACT10_13660 [soil metagenome]